MVNYIKDNKKCIRINSGVSEMDDNKYIHIDKLAIYTDGSCLGNPGSGGWCYILNAENRNNKIIAHDGVKNTTNNRMELQAFLEASAPVAKSARSRSRQILVL